MMSTIRTTIQKAADGQDLTRSEAEDAMKEIMSGHATPAQIGAFLTALRVKGEAIREIAAFARVMRQFATRIEPQVNDILVDTCGTGGDKMNTINISTGAMFVAAGAGVIIAKHGNRSVTSKAGCADVLETLGVKIDVRPEVVKRSIEDIGIGFMFAPTFHGAMKHAIGPRKEIGLRTVFNILGPLTNPGGAKAQVMGVYDYKLTEKLARVLSELGCERSMVVHGLDGMDEISTVGKTRISELEDGRVRTYTIKPEDYQIPRTKPKEIAGKDAKGNARELLKVLRGKRGPHRDVIQLNAAAAILMSGKAEDLNHGLELAGEAIDSGLALEKLIQLVQSTKGEIKKLEALGDFF